MKQNNQNLNFVIQAKSEYRRAARAKTWEEKIESIVRMRAASKLAKQSMLLSSQNLP
jgi:hypothetical protein